MSELPKELKEITEWQKMSEKELAKNLTPDQHMRAIEWYLVQNAK